MKKTPEQRAATKLEREERRKALPFARLGRPRRGVDLELGHESLIGVRREDEIWYVSFSLEEAIAFAAALNSRIRYTLERLNSAAATLPPPPELNR